MALQQNNAEGMPHGTTIAVEQTGSGTPISNIDTTGTITGVYSNVRAAHGSQSYRITASPNSILSMRFQASIAATAAARFYVYFESLPSGVMAIAGIYSTEPGLAMASVAYVGGRFIIQDRSGTTLTTFPTTLSVGQWYRIEMRATAGTTSINGTVWAAYYLLDSTTPVDPALSTSLADTTTSEAYRFSVGKRGTAPAVDMYIDDIAFDTGVTAAIGPYVAPTNVAPVAQAGPDQLAVEPWSQVTLNGSGSADNDGTIASYAWTQTAGTAVTLSSYTAMNPTFVAPAAIADQTLTFGLVVTDDQGENSTSDTVTVRVLGATERAVIGGQEVPVKLEAVGL